MTHMLHPGAKLVEPYQQGGLDALCGLYVLINGALLLHAEANPLSGQRCKRLFAEGMDFLTAQKGSRDAAHRGMTVGRQRRLAKALFKGEALANRPPLRLGPTLPQMAKVDDLETAIEGALASGAILLVCFQGRISHHSIIVGQTPARVLLCDSDRMRFVQKASLQFCTKQRDTLMLDSLVPMHSAAKPS